MSIARKPPARKLNGLECGLAVALFIATLYFAQEVLIPIALSVLLTFLLSPLANRLQRAGLHRISAVLTVTAAAFAVILALGWVVGGQIVHLAEDLQKEEYRNEIHSKFQRVSGFGGRIGAKFDKLGSELGKAPAEEKKKTDESADGGLVARAAEQTDAGITKTAARETARAGPTTVSSEAGLTPENPFYAVALPAPESPVRTLGAYVGYVLGPLGNAALVVVFVVFMLLDREDLRDRAIRLLSSGKYTVTTRALDDAGQRISRYVLAQTMVNGSYGLVVAIGLFIVGLASDRLTGGHGRMFPSFVLWGLLCAVLRFIPYVGPFTAAAFPLALSLAVYPGFAVFFVVAGMLILIELVSNNVMEPWLYGSSTGLSTMAILVAAVFWTWLWGPIGLFMSTPLTVCIVVLGKHVTQLKFLDVLLGDQPALPPGVRFYQRLLAVDEHEAELVLHEVARRDGGDQVPDKVLLPALRMARRDYRDGDLSAEEETRLLDTAERLLDKRSIDCEERAKLAAAALPDDADPAAIPVTGQVLGCPAHHRSEELTLEALSQLGLPNQFCVDMVSSRLLHTQIEQRVRDKSPAMVFIAVLPPGGMPQARYLCRRLRKAFPDLPIVVGVWGRVRNFDKLLVRFRKVGANYVTTSMVQSRNQILALLRPRG